MWSIAYDTFDMIKYWNLVEGLGRVDKELPLTSLIAGYMVRESVWSMFDLSVQFISQLNEYVQLHPIIHLTRPNVMHIFFGGGRTTSLYSHLVFYAIFLPNYSIRNIRVESSQYTFVLYIYSTITITPPLVFVCINTKLQ